MTIETSYLDFNLANTFEGYQAYMNANEPLEMFIYTMNIFIKFV